MTINVVNELLNAGHARDEILEKTRQVAAQLNAANGIGPELARDYNQLRNQLAHFDSYMAALNLTFRLLKGDVMLVEPGGIIMLDDGTRIRIEEVS